MNARLCQGNPRFSAIEDSQFGKIISGLQSILLNIKVPVSTSLARKYTKDTITVRMVKNHPINDGIRKILISRHAWLMTKAIPFTAPKTTKCHAGPCHSPESKNVIIIGVPTAAAKVSVAVKFLSIEKRATESAIGE